MRNVAAVLRRRHVHAKLPRRFHLRVERERRLERRQELRRRRVLGVGLGRVGDQPQADGGWCETGRAAEGFRDGGVDCELLADGRVRSARWLGFDANLFAGDKRFGFDQLQLFVGNGRDILGFSTGLCRAGSNGLVFYHRGCSFALLLLLFLRLLAGNTKVISVGLLRRCRVIVGESNTCGNAADKPGSGKNIGA